MPELFAFSHFTLKGLDFWVGLLLYFYIFAVVGWFIEMIYLSTSGRGLINSGFLQGPVCPAYAAGVLIIYPFTIWFAPLPFVVQIVLYAALATAVEYLAHFSLEATLGIRIWDYSDEFMNFQGRISLKYTIFWLFLVLFLVMVMQPAAITFIQWLPTTVRFRLALFLGAVLVVDYILSALLFSGMTRRIKSVCTAFDLPWAEMQDLQFNRPRIMNEKKRLAKLMADPVYAGLNMEVKRRLFEGEMADYLDFDIANYADIVENNSYRLWRSSSATAEHAYRRFRRAAELAKAFCDRVGLDGNAAARGLLMAAYTSDKQGPVVKVFDILLPQRRVLFNGTRNLGPISRVERDVILRYTWPLNFGPPRTHECLVASFAEKLVNSEEFRHVLRRLYGKAFQ